MGKDEGKAEQHLGTKGFIHKINDLWFGLKKKKDKSKREEHALLLPPRSQTILVSQ